MDQQWTRQLAAQWKLRSVENKFKNNKPSSLPLLQPSLYCVGSLCLVVSNQEPSSMMQQQEELIAEFYKILEVLDDKAATDSLKELLSWGFKPDALHDGNTSALHLACGHKNLGLVKVLLENGANILWQDKNDGDTAIHMASIGGDPNVLDTLFNWLNRPPRIQTPQLGEVALTRMEHLQVHKRQGSRFHLEVLNRKGRTPLHRALAKGQVEAVVYLLENGANINATDYTGMSAIHFAAKAGSNTLEIVEYKLRSTGIILGLDWLEQATNFGFTALHLAARRGSTSAVDWLLERGAVLNPTTRDSSTPIHLAASRGHIETVKRLVSGYVNLAKQRPVQDLFKQNNARKDMLQLVEEHNRKDMLPLLKHIKDKGLLNQAVVPHRVLLRYILAYGDQEMKKILRKNLLYLERRTPDAVKKLFTTSEGDQGTLLEWAASKPRELNLEKTMKLAEEFMEEAYELHLERAFQVALLENNNESASKIAKDRKALLPRWIKGMKPHLLEKKAKMNELVPHQKDDIRVQIPTWIGYTKEIIYSAGNPQDWPVAYLLFHIGSENIANFIKEQGIWTDIVNETTGTQEYTALHVATIRRDRAVVSRLCEIKECRANITDSEERTAYRYAVYGNSKDIQRELEEKEDVRSYLDLSHRDRRVCVDALNAILVGAALIANVSFGGFKRPPEVNSPDLKFKLFWISNALSFFFAMATALAAARGVLPNHNMYIRDVVKGLHITLEIASITLALSIGCSLLAFAAVSVMAVPSKLKFDVIVAIAVGALGCLVMLVWFGQGIYSSISRSRSQFKNKVVPAVEIRAERTTLKVKDIGMDDKESKLKVQDESYGASAEETASTKLLASGKRRSLEVKINC